MIVDTFQNLNERYQLRDLFFLQSYLDEYFLQPDRHMLFIDGSLTLDHDLVLNWGGLESMVPDNKHALFGLIVMGDLTIAGGMLNSDTDSGPLLLVRGNLVAHNLFAGGGEIVIGRNANIRDVVFANYNHGCLTIGERLDAGLLVMLDHSFNKREVCALHKVDELLECDRSEASSKDKKRLRALNSLLITPMQTFDDLEKELALGRDVLKNEARNLREIPLSSFHERKEDIVEFVKQSKYVGYGAIPPALRQDRAFMLQLTGLHPDIFNFLKNGWHLDPEFMHAALDAKNPNVAGYIRHVEDEAQRRALESRTSIVHL